MLSQISLNGKSRRLNIYNLFTIASITFTGTARSHLLTGTNLHDCAETTGIALPQNQMAVLSGSYIN